MKDFRGLEVWRKSHALTLQVYRESTRFPANEQYGLTSQLRRSCASIPANIAEGCGRDSDADFARFLQIATGSATETDYHLLLAHDLGFLDDQLYDVLSRNIWEIQRMLAAFLRKLRTAQ